MSKLIHSLLLSLAGAFALALAVVLNLALAPVLGYWLLAPDLVLLFSSLIIATYLGGFSVPVLKTFLKREYYRVKFRQEKKAKPSFYLKFLATLIILFKSAEEGFEVIKDEAREIHGRALLFLKAEKKKSKALTEQLKRVHLTKQRRAAALSASAVFLFITGSLLTALFATLMYPDIFRSQAATYTWTQSSWSGGTSTDIAVHSSNQSGWNKYASKDDNVDTSGDQLTLSAGSSQIEQTTTGDFEGGDVNDSSTCLVWSDDELKLIRKVSYGGQDYPVVQIEDQCWMAENLNIGSRINGGSNQTDNGTIEKYCYNNSESNCDTYGGLYQWNEAMQYTTDEATQGICPSGWHIPSEDELYILENYLADSTCNPDRDPDWNSGDDCDPAGTKLKSGGSSGFEGLLAGLRSTDGSFGNLGTHAGFWSSSESGSDAWRLSLSSDHSTVNRSTNSQARGFSVRCLKD